MKKLTELLNYLNEKNERYILEYFNDETHFINIHLSNENFKYLISYDYKNSIINLLRHDDDGNLIEFKIEIIGLDLYL